MKNLAGLVIILLVPVLAAAYLWTPGAVGGALPVGNPLLQGEAPWVAYEAPVQKTAAVSTAVSDEVDLLSDWEYTRFKRPVSPAKRPIPRPIRTW